MRNILYLKFRTSKFVKLDYILAHKVVLVGEISFKQTQVCQKRKMKTCVYLSFSTRQACWTVSLLIFQPLCLPYLLKKSCFFNLHSSKTWQYVISHLNRHHALSTVNFFFLLIFLSIFWMNFLIKFDKDDLFIMKIIFTKFNQKIKPIFLA